MTPAGHLNIRLTVHGERVEAVHIVSSRPSGIDALLRGRTPQQLLDTVPLLFTVCANAQAAAALTVCRSVLDKSSSSGMEAARQLLVEFEILREHGWRILLDWPDLIGTSADKAALATLLKFDLHLKRALFLNGEAFKLDSRLQPDTTLRPTLSAVTALVNQAVFAGSMNEFLDICDDDGLRSWLSGNPSAPARLLSHIYQQDWAELGRNDIGCLPELGAIELNAELSRDPAAYSRLPQWQGRCMESTLLNRHQFTPLIADLLQLYGNGLLAHLAACLREVAEIPERLFRLSALVAVDTPLPADELLADGIALSQVQAARGLLVHRLRLAYGRIASYHVVAPTEWNFHPEGVAAGGLKQLTGDETRLRRQAALWITAIDPCVQYDLSLA